MSHFLDRLTFFKEVHEPFSAGYGIIANEDQGWEHGHRKRWQHDKVVRSKHCTNCTGSCSWKIYVKAGIVTFQPVDSEHLAGGGLPW